MYILHRYEIYITTKISLHLQSALIKKPIPIITESFTDYAVLYIFFNLSESDI